MKTTEMDTKQIIDTVSNQVQDTVATKSHSVAMWIGAQATAWTLTIAQVNGLLTSLSLLAATTFSIYMIYLKYKEAKKKSQAE